MIKNKFRKLEKEIGYRFRKKHFLETALTHPSYSNENSADQIQDNQRMEFLGDAVLGLMCASYIYSAHPDFCEGQMTKLRASLANSKELAKLGKGLDLGDYLRLGKGETNMGGHKRPSNITDAMEGIIGAAYLDGGYKAAYQIFKKHFIEEVPEFIDAEPTENPKGTLQERIQRQYKASPTYEMLGEEGPPHHREYHAEVKFGDTTLGEGRGFSKQAAEVAAAVAALDALGAEPPADATDQADASEQPIE